MLSYMVCNLLGQSHVQLQSVRICVMLSLLSVWERVIVRSRLLCNLREHGSRLVLSVSRECQALKKIWQCVLMHCRHECGVHI